MITFLNILWFFLIFLLIAGYFVLDGFDLGAGVLSPFISDDERDLSIIRRSIGPVWDGNEVWLLAAGGALFAAFPDAYATTFSGFYLAVILVLFGLILRAVSVEFAGTDRAWSGLWNVLFFVGSLLPALLLGVAVGNIMAGIPMDANGDYIGVPLFGLITPFTLLVGLMGLVFCLLQGSMWLAQKAPAGSTVQVKSARLRVPLAIIEIALFVIATIWMIPSMGLMFEPLAAIRIILAIVVAAGLIAAIVFSLNNNNLFAFLASSVAMFAIVFLLACTMFPNLVMATPDSIGPTISLANAASSETSLFYMTVIACIGVPLVLLYHVVVYRVFRGRVKNTELEEY